MQLVFSLQAGMEAMVLTGQLSALAQAEPLMAMLFDRIFDEGEG